MSEEKASKEAPVGFLYQFKDEKPVFMQERQDWADNHPLWKETCLYDHSKPSSESTP